MIVCVDVSGPRGPQRAVSPRHLTAHEVYHETGTQPKNKMAAVFYRCRCALSEISVRYWAPVK